MINLLYDKLPSSVNIDGKSYPIATDFRDWVAFFDMILDDELTEKDKCLGAFNWFTETIPSDVENAYNALISFAGCNDIKFSYSPCGKISKTSAPVLSYLYDSPYIFSAFLQVYNINLRTIKYMHWYEFKSLFDGLPEDTPIKKRMAYRSINLSDIKDKKERERIKKIKNDIKLPSKRLTAEQAGNVF